MPLSEILLIASNTSYRLEDFLRAAERSRLDVTVVSDRCRVLLEKWPSARHISIKFTKKDESLEKISTFCRGKNISAVIGCDDVSLELAAILSRQFEIPGNTLHSIKRTRNKFLFREKLAGDDRLNSPDFHLAHLSDDVARVARSLAFPCVLKPVFLSGSRGVIRANDFSEFKNAFFRIKRMLTQPEFAQHDSEWTRRILIEDYIPGIEIAIEGLLTKGKLEVLAIFDKPDPLEGPFFEETLYITPSRLENALQNEIQRQLAIACHTLGLFHGPVHAEARLNENGVFFLEIAARTIGGLCGRTLTFAAGMSLEEIILKHAIGESIMARTAFGGASSGVMMIPIPKGGKLESVFGVQEAMRVEGVQDVEISIAPGNMLVPLPEGSSYLGFIFSKGDSPECVESALRKAHALLEFDIRPAIPVMEDAAPNPSYEVHQPC